ncbi:thioredoxin family protein [Iodidimonas nitroreducens]|uniref:Thioredoxin family protein n=1 Tax=Iodidimonas nitroreducens TaxID=1236968 RepID=A0A5A7N8B6_9PROT|nr:redoxin domain-containing protein [Iodidimonas nitroreducens]GAK32528.1 ahpC/TSA family protein [alpha proteobacterium Q-1]GER04582.1 thioredoxin family protein [Iodidimonas nitroreducens]
MSMRFPNLAGAFVLKGAALLFAAAGLLAGAFVAQAQPMIGEEAPLFAAKNTRGETISLEALRGHPVILEWTNHDCPFVKKHYETGNMQKTQRALVEAGVTWISIISSAPGTQGHVSADEANSIAASRGSYADHIILDPQGDLGRLYKARTTPDMFLIDGDGTLLYQGAIDDKPSARHSSIEGAKNYVLAAFQDMQAGQPVREAETKPYGCSVKYAF